MPLEITIVAHTTIDRDAMAKVTEWVWEPDEDDTPGAALAEFAGRGCYGSWPRPNEETATNEGYLRHIAEVGHFNLYEHPTLTVYVTGVSRSLTHELVRHRAGFGYSQLSQRFVVLKNEGTSDDYIVPPLFEGDNAAGDILEDAWEAAVRAYDALLKRAREIAAAQGLDGTAAKKAAREAARAVLPNMTPTAITITGNHRAFRNTLMQRLQPAADAEIRRFAWRLFKTLSHFEPALYQDLEVVMVDGKPSLVAKS